MCECLCNFVVSNYVLWDYLTVFVHGAAVVLLLHLKQIGLNGLLIWFSQDRSICNSSPSNNLVKI